MSKLLILDIDETLIHSESFTGPDYLEKNTYDFSFPLGDDKWCYTLKRPFLDEFLNYAFTNFKVAIWTAAGLDYANEILSKCGINKDKLEFFWTNEKCTMRFDFSKDQYYGVKNLSKVKDSFGFNLNDILIVDDVEKTAENNYGNLILIKEFYNSKNDTELLKLINYLDKIKNVDNFRSLEKRGWSK